MLKEITQCLGYEQLTSLSGSSSLTVPTSSGGQKANVALLIGETQSIRWRDDGTAPTASVGMLLAAGQPFLYDGDLTKIRFIEATASAKLNVSYYA